MTADYCIVLNLSGMYCNVLYRWVYIYCCWSTGKGLTLVGSVLEGDYAEKYANALAAKQTISAMMKKEKARGFAEVVVAEHMTQGLCYLWVIVGRNKADDGMRTGR